jgi:amino acid transporter
MTITYFSFFGLLATSILIFFLPFIDNRFFYIFNFILRFGYGMLVLSFILFILLQYFMRIIDKEKEEEAKQK